MPLGSFLIFNLANPLQSAFSWRGVWWFGALAALIALAVYMGVMTGPPTFESSGHKSLERKDQQSFAAGLKSPAIWLLAIGFGTFGFANAGVTTWSPRFFTEVHGIQTETANFYASLGPMFSIASTILAGWIIDKLKRPRTVLLISAALTGVFYGYIFFLNSAGLIVPWMILAGLVVGFYPTATFTLAPEAVTSPQMAGLAMAILNMMFNLGFMLGPPVVGTAVNKGHGNWTAGAIPIIIVLIIGIAVSGGFAVIKRQKA